MKKDKPILLYTLLIIVFLFIVITFYLNTKIINCNKNLNNIKNENKEENNIKNEIDKEPNSKDYTCKLVETFKIVNLLEGYVSEIPEISYVVVDNFQTHLPQTYMVPSNLKNKLEINKTYEFTYSLEGKGVITNKEDIYNYLTTNLTEQKTNVKVTLNINELANINNDISSKLTCTNK